jgi:WD40 repeat protein/DNA-binding SARP family transcriptional activator
MATLKISVLGHLQISAGKTILSKFESNKVRALLAYLVVEMNRPHSREALAEMFWPESPIQSSLANLRYALADLRKVIEDEKQNPPYLIISRENLQFNTSSDYELDAATFSELLNSDNIEKLKQGIALYQGDFLASFPSIESDPFEEWILLKRELFKRQAIEALRLITDHHEQRGEYQQALPFARRQVELEPWLEEAHQQLMHVLALDGQRSAALAQYETCRRTLASELDVEPTQETIQLYESIRDGELEKVPHLLKREPPAPGAPPFKGLQYFDETDADLFFGREALVSHLVDQIHSREKTKGAQFLAIIGASGSGKSSLVRAGLIPALKRGGMSRRVHVITPTEHPLEALSSRLKKDSISKEHILLFVDQFEELFTLCQSEGERKSFINNLLRAAQVGSASVVIALRADFYAACAPYENLRKTLSQNQEYIGPMNAGELRRAIEEPARANGWLFEPGLVDLLLHDIGADGDQSPEPGALPLLSHALLETWHRRSGRMLTLAGYAESGRIHEAITKTAETVFAQFSLEEQSIARNIFLRLTELGEGTQETRRRVLLSEILPPSESASLLSKKTETVLKMLSDARLVITTEATAEVAHEALIREWTRLREWLTDNREGLRLHRYLTEAAQEWDRLGRDPGLLYRKTRLGQALEWVDTHSSDSNSLEQDFLSASKAFAEQEIAEREFQRKRELEAARRLAESERERAEQQMRTTRQLRTRAIYLSAAFIAAIILAIVAVFLEQKASQETEIARSNELAAASISNLNLDPERSILLALQALSTANTHQAEDALHRAVQASRIKFTLSGHTDEVSDVEFSPDGTRLASASLDYTAKIWDFASGKELFTLRGHTDQVMQIRFSPDGTRLATASWDGTAKIWDVATGQALMTLSGHTVRLTDIKYSPDGKLLATLAVNHTVVVWDAESGKELFTLTESGKELLPLHDTWLFFFSFSPDGSKLAIGYDDGIIKVWDIITQQAILTLSGGHDAPVYSVSFSPDGKKLVSDDGVDSIVVWDLQNGEQLAALSGYYPAFDPNGSLLASWTGEADLVIYNASNYQRIYSFAGHTAGGNATIFNQDGSLLATPNADGTIKILDMTNGRELFALSGHAGGVGDAAFSPGCVRPPEAPFAQCRQYLATASRDKTIKIWDVTPAGNREIVTVPGFVSFFSADGKRLITGVFNDPTTVTYSIWDMTTTGKEHEVSSFSVSHPAPIIDGGYNPDATLAGTVSLDGTVKVLNLMTDEITLTFNVPQPIDSVIDVSILASGPRLTTISPNKELTVWDTVSGKRIATLPVFPGTVTAVSFSPDGSQMAVILNENSTATLWNLVTGEKSFDLIGHTQPLYNASFSLDGRRLVTVGKDGTAIVWDTQTGKHLLTLSGHSASIQVAVFSKDGTRLATGGYDGAVKVWDVSAGPTSGQELLNLSGYSSFIYTLDFSPDGRYLAASSFGDGTTRVYALRIEDLIAIARSRLTRSFTLEECQKYLHQPICP